MVLLLTLLQEGSGWLPPCSAVVVLLFGVAVLVSPRLAARLPCEDSGLTHNPPTSCAVSMALRILCTWDDGIGRWGCVTGRSTLLGTKGAMGLPPLLIVVTSTTVGVGVAASTRGSAGDRRVSELGNNFWVRNPIDVDGRVTRAEPTDGVRSLLSTTAVMLGLAGWPLSSGESIGGVILPCTWMGDRVGATDEDAFSDMPSCEGERAATGRCFAVAGLGLVLAVVFSSSPGATSGTSFNFHVIVSLVHSLRRLMPSDVRCVPRGPRCGAFGRCDLSSSRRSSTRRRIWSDHFVILSCIICTCATFRAEMNSVLRGIVRSNSSSQRASRQVSSSCSTARWTTSCAPSVISAMRVTSNVRISIMRSSTRSRSARREKASFSVDTCVCTTVSSRFV
eukprot:PhM_4_TR12803/c0_g1_i1/m.32640